MTAFKVFEDAELNKRYETLIDLHGGEDIFSNFHPVSHSVHVIV